MQETVSPRFINLLHTKYKAYTSQACLLSLLAYRNSSISLRSDANTVGPTHSLYIPPQLYPMILNHFYVQFPQLSTVICLFHCRTVSSCLPMALQAKFKRPIYSKAFCFHPKGLHPPSQKQWFHSRADLTDQQILPSKLHLPNPVRST